jgi:hypothetical protein
MKKTLLALGLAVMMAVPASAALAQSASDDGAGNSDSNASGTGIGLNIARTIARHHDGDLTAHSEGPGTGATMTFVVPGRSAPVANVWSRRGPIRPKLGDIPHRVLPAGRRY